MNNKQPKYTHSENDLFSIVSEPVETLNAGIPQWEKDFIDKRLDMAQHQPERLQPVEILFETL